MLSSIFLNPSWSGLLAIKKDHFQPRKLALSPWYGVSCNKLLVSIKRVTEGVDVCGVQLLGLPLQTFHTNVDNRGKNRTLITRANGVWFTMTLALVMNEEESLTNQITMLITLRCTLTQSVLLRFKCGDTSSSSRNYLKANWDEPWTQRTDESRAPRPRITRNNQLWQIRYITRVAQTRKNNNEDLRTASVSEQVETTSTDTIHEKTGLNFLICACHPHTVSHFNYSTNHGGRYNIVVMASTSQHPALKRLSWDESFCPQSCEYHAPILHCLHNRKSALFPSLCVSGSNNSAQCSSNPKTLHFLQQWMSNTSFRPICRELLMAHVLWSSLPRFPAYSACSSRWDQAGWLFINKSLRSYLHHYTSTLEKTIFRHSTLNNWMNKRT